MMGTPSNSRFPVKRSCSCSSSSSSSTNSQPSSPSRKSTTHSSHKRLNSASAAHSSTSTEPNDKPIHIFYVWYAELCRRHNSNPVTSVRSPNQRNDQVLQFNADRIKLEDWYPLINAIKTDTSLHVISINSKMPTQNLNEEADTEEKVKKIKKWYGVICTKYVLRNLVKAICNSLKLTEVLTCLELDGLKISGNYLKLILKNLLQNTTVKYLSLKSCPIGDVGCEEICQAIRALPNIQIINMSGCELTSKSGQHISKLIKYQQINRYCESWHSSLRYSDPVLNKMGGLRRITINNNPKIGNDGLDLILDELMDDLWIKAIDMQRCGITEGIAEKIIDIIEYSKSLEVFDFRNNHLSPASLEQVFEILKCKQDFEKDEDQNTEYQWCFTSTTLDTMTYGSYMSLMKTKSAKNIENKKVAVSPFSKTMPHLQIMNQSLLPTKQIKENMNNIVKPAPKRELRRDPHPTPKETNKDAEVYIQIEKERLKRKQVEKKCLELEKQIEILKTQETNEVILTEFSNMKQYINKFIKFVVENGGINDETNSTIHDLQSALKEVHNLTKSSDVMPRHLVDEEDDTDWGTLEVVEEEDLIEDGISITEEPINKLVRNQPTTHLNINASLQDTDLKIRCLFENLIGVSNDDHYDVGEFGEQDDEKMDTSFQSERLSNSSSDETLKQLLDELDQEDDDDWLV